MKHWKLLHEKPEVRKLAFWFQKLMKYLNVILYRELMKHLKLLKFINVRRKN